MKRILLSSVSFLIIALLLIVTPICACGYTLEYPGLNNTFRQEEFTYDDEWFLYGLEDYGWFEDVAHTSMALAASAYDQTCIRNALVTMGFNESEVWQEYSLATQGDTDSVAFTFAHKSTSIEEGFTGQPMEIYAIVIRGTMGEEWLSNFNVYDKGQGVTEHQGFSLGAWWVEQKFAEYYRKLGDQDKRNNIIWITGHSRGAAVADLLAEKLYINERFSPWHGLFPYTFAAPNTVYWTDKSSLPARSIFWNFINDGDLVCALPPAAWGYQRYGRTVNLGENFGSNAVNGMKEQFQQITGETYQGLTASQRDTIANIIVQVAPNRDNYPKNLMKAIAYYLMGERAKTLVLLRDLGRSIKLGALLALEETLDKDETVKAIFHAHSTEAYLAWTRWMAANQQPKQDSGW